jgi:hypothetical protein
MAFVKGRYIDPADFAYKTYWKAFQDFLGHTDRVSEGRWGIIMDEKDADEDDDQIEVDESMISAYRGDLYIPSSPQKP